MFETYRSVPKSLVRHAIGLLFENSSLGESLNGSGGFASITIRDGTQTYPCRACSTGQAVGRRERHV